MKLMISVKHGKTKGKVLRPDYSHENNQGQARLEEELFKRWEHWRKQQASAELALLRRSVNLDFIQIHREKEAIENLKKEKERVARAYKKVSGREVTR